MRGFFKEISFEIERQNFIFAEVEENEEELEKLKAWLKKVEKRDFVNAPLKRKLLRKLRNVQEFLRNFQREYIKKHRKNKEIMED